MTLLYQAHHNVECRQPPISDIGTQHPRAPLRCGDARRLTKFRPDRSSHPDRSARDSSPTMAAVDDYSRPTTPENGSGDGNGTGNGNGSGNGSGSNGNGLRTPRTPRTGLALTEYSANPSPPGEGREKSSVVPEAFLLPSGYPDVSGVQYMLS